MVEARRITGVHHLLPGVGAGLEIELDGDLSPGEFARQWEARARDLAAALGWPAPTFGVRVHASGLSLAFTAPIDQLNTAVDVAEAALAPETPGEVARLTALAEEEADPALRAFAATVTGGWFHDEDRFTVGYGRFSVTTDRPPAGGHGEVVPTVLVTGTNGKTTTTRWIAHIATEAGRVAGHTCSDGVVVGEDVLEDGDWSGPGAARRLLRDPRVEFAVLETARGGLCRRGLAIHDYPVAVCTNISDDHLGEWGLHDLDAMADAKLVVGRGLGPSGTLIAGPGAELDRGVARLLLMRPDLQVLRYADRDGVTDGRVVNDALFVRVGDATATLPIAEIPALRRGAARYNVENALGAGLAALALGLPESAVVSGWRSFATDTRRNLGRANLFEVSGARVLLDFAHNPDGLRRIAAFGEGAARRLVLLGQAGDRPDELLDRLARAAIGLGPDLVFIKDLAEHRRGRAPGEVPALLREALLRNGLAAASLVDAGEEGEAIVAVLDALQPGDFAFLLVHEMVPFTLAELRRRGAREV